MSERGGDQYLVAVDGGSSIAETHELSPISSLKLIIHTYQISDLSGI
jgi:hypothetical protein